MPDDGLYLLLMEFMTTGMSVKVDLSVLEKFFNRCWLMEIIGSVFIRHNHADRWEITGVTPLVPAD